MLSVNATKRLQVLQNLDTLGAGFTLASHDLDIRGAGNIVGEKQSGHIREVGVELYQTLLQEAIMMTQVKNANQAESPEIHDWTPQISLGVPVLIPEQYVADLGLRLNLYRRVSNLSNRGDIESFAVELIDRFGKLPPEVKNLLDVVELKGLCRRANIEKIDSGPKGVLITFKENTSKDPAKLISYLQKPEVAKSGAIKIRPDHKLFFGRDFSHPELRRKGTLRLVQELADL
jgi:transcription-repair coupling factor (superfamily II helicase)